MTRHPHGRPTAGEAPSTRAFYDIGQLLESADGAEARVTRVLERLHSLVPYERCAVLEALPGRATRLIAAPGTPPPEEPGLMQTLAALLDRLRDGLGPAGPADPIGTHLAVPLVGLDEVLGVLFVRGAEGTYEERHVRALSVVASKLAAYLSLVRSLAETTERARQLDAAREAAEAAGRARDEFLAVVSHELRTPLVTILASADALRSREADDQDRARAYDAIERSVRAQVEIIDNLLDVTSAAAATLPLKVRSVEPAPLLRQVVEALQPRACAKSVRLEAVLDDSVTAIVADPRRLGQIVNHLVGNAIKFTPEGGHVELRLEPFGSRARIRVADSGAGMRPEVLRHVFEPFSQADSSTTRAQGGIGVGLALVKGLVERHGGRIAAESPGKNRGATFTVDLPLAGPQAAHPARTTPAERSPEEPCLAGVRVLVVDGDRDIGEVLQAVLEGQGAAVALAASAAEALTTVERWRPDVLVSDIALPGRSGYALMQAIEERRGAGTLPAAALTDGAREQDLRRARASGFRMLLAKPVDTAALVAAVAALAGRTAGAGV